MNDMKSFGLPFCGITIDYMGSQQHDLNFTIREYRKFQGGKRVERVVLGPSVVSEELT